MGQALQAGGGFFGVLGSYHQAQQEKAALEASQRIGAQNARIAKGQADYVGAEAKDAEAQQRAGASRDRGRLSALLAASGVDLSEGSALGHELINGISSSDGP